MSADGHQRGNGSNGHQRGNGANGSNGADGHGGGDERTPLVGIAMGSASDLPTMQAAADVLGALGVPYEVRVVSAHRTPHDMVRYGSEAAGRGLRVLVAGAGGAADPVLAGRLLDHAEAQAARSRASDEEVLADARPR